MMGVVEVLILLFCFLPRLEMVVFEPAFDAPMVNATVKEGATAILPCSVSRLGEHQVVWTDQWSTLLTFEDRRIIDDERLSVERPYTKDWNLHIRNVKYSDEGIYNCQINTSPVKIKTVTLKVQVPAKIISKLSSDHTTIREGETVSLMCNVTGIPMPTVTWYRHKTTQDNIKKESEFCPGTNRIGVSGEVLIIHNVSRYCGDTYECVAFNGVPPSVSRNINVAVEFPPEVRLQNKRIGQDRGKETILECIITAYPQEISVWKRNGREIANSVKYRVEIYNDGDHTITLSLRIRLLEEEDFGEYICEASNRLGVDREKMTLFDYSPYRKTTTERRPRTTVTMTTEQQTYRIPFRPTSQPPYNHDRVNNQHRGNNHQTRVTPVPKDQGVQGAQEKTLVSANISHKSSPLVLGLLLRLALLYTISGVIL